MDRSTEEMRVITSLISSLNSQIVDSSDHINKLEKLAKELVPRDQSDNFLTSIPDSGQINELSIEDEDEFIIQKLEKTRLELVMDIQKQDYITEKLSELIDGNEDIIGNVKEYLSNKNSLRQEEEKFAKVRINEYIENNIQPIIGRLDINLFDLYTGIYKTGQLVNYFTDNIQKNNEILQSEEYQEKLNTLINILNKIFKKYNHNEQLSL